MKENIAAILLWAFIGTSAGYSASLYTEIPYTVGKAAASAALGGIVAVVVCLGILIDQSDKCLLNCPEPYSDDEKKAIEDLDKLLQKQNTYIWENK